MNRAKRSIILCLCAALLLIPPMTSCDLLEEIQKQIEALGYPDYKDLGDEPYRIEIQDGVAVIDFNPCYTKPFVLEIPETDENGNPVTAVRSDPATGMLPTIISEEDFALFQGKLEEYYGITYDEASALLERMEQDHPAYEQAFYLKKHLVYFMYKSLNECTSDRLRADMLAVYPITAKMNIYALDTSAHASELMRIYTTAHEAAPELTDVWYYEACLRAEHPYTSGLGETMTEIRFPSGITEIGELTFAGCHALKSVTVPGTVKTVDDCAFAACDSLEEITFEEGVTTIDYFALYGSPQIKTVNLPASLESLMFLFDATMVADSAWALPTINYGGTMAQWEELFRGVWSDDSDEVEYGEYAYFDIHCSDGVVEATLVRNETK